MLLVGLVGLMCTPTTAAAPRDLAELPASLQKYIPGTPEWMSSPWMTSPDCQNKGGDFSLWAHNVIADIPELISVFFTELFTNAGAGQDHLRSQAIAAGFHQLSTEFRDAVPTGYCVDDVKRWTGATPDYTPFGFEWGITRQSTYGCTDGRTDEKDRDADNRWVGAERAPCEGFAVACGTAVKDERARCDAWNAFSGRFTHRSQQLRSEAISQHPATAVAAVHAERPVQWVVLVATGGLLTITGIVVLTLRRRRNVTGDNPERGDVDA